MTTPITMMVMTDGRAHYLLRSAASWHHLRNTFTGARVIHDDSGDDTYRDWLRCEFPGWEIIGDGPRLGFAGAMRRARAWLAQEDRTPYVWWQEDDFELTRPIDVDAMVSVLGAYPGIAQMALRRQPWNAAEKAAGGIIERWPYDFDPVTTRGHDWLRHRRWFTTNPALLPRSVITTEEWPDGPDSEGRFGSGLFERGWACGFWGDYESGEWCLHIGHDREGCGY